MSLRQILNENSSSFTEKMEKIILEVGAEPLKACLPFSEEEIEKAYQEDEHLNSIPLEKWCEAVGVDYKVKENTIYTKAVDTPFRKLLKDKGVFDYEYLDVVPILKKVALWRMRGLI